MTNKITKEDLFNYLCNELDIDRMQEIENALSKDDELKLQLAELKSIRMLQAETMLPLLNKPMNSKTEALIESIKEKKTLNLISLIKLSPIAIVGWLGFASVGTMQVAQVFNDQPSFERNMSTARISNNVYTNSIESAGIKLRGEQSTIENNINGYEVFLEDILVGESFYLKHQILKNKTLLISKVFKNNEDICLLIKLESENLDQNKDEQEICFQQD